VVLDLEVGWTDRASGAHGATRLVWRCSSQGHLEARTSDADLGDLPRRKLDNLFRTSVWTKVDALRKRRLETP